MMAVGGGASSAVGETVTVGVTGTEVGLLLQEVNKRRRKGTAMKGFMVVRQHYD
jgi:hypothetical protein